MRRFLSVCVFCGSSYGEKKEYAETAAALGTALAREGVGLVYGGAKVGTMGELARAALASGGKVTGVMPRSLVDMEVAFKDRIDLRIVGDMHERKALMAKLSDGFIALPGGIGTMEEIFEVLTFSQLEFHDKPVAFLNVEGYYDKLQDFLAHVSSEGFLLKDHLDMIIFEEEIGPLLLRMREFKAPKIDKAAWIKSKGSKKSS